MIGGFVADGNNSAHVDAYSIGADSWHRLPDLPVAVEPRAAAAECERVCVRGRWLRRPDPSAPAQRVFVLVDGAWRRLPPAARRACSSGCGHRGRHGSTCVGGRDERRDLARVAFVLQALWLNALADDPGPEPSRASRGGVSLGRVYAIGGGATRGIDTNERALEVYDASARRWQRLMPLPGARGGTGAAALGGRIVSVGGEQPTGTIPTVYAYDVRKGAGRGSPICRRRVTASASWRRATASGRSRAARSPGSP